MQPQPIFQFTDFRTYLRTHAEEKRILNPKWSFGMWARQLGISSTAVLTNVLHGKRNPGPSIEQKLIRYFKFNDREKEYFSDLVRLEKVNQDTRLAVALMEKMERLNPNKSFHFLDDATFQVISKWHTYAIREMTNLAHFQENPKWIQKNLEFKASVPEIKKAISHLLALGLVERTPQGKLHVTHKTIKLEGESVSEARKRFHEHMLEHAKTSLRQHEASERDMTARTFNIDEKNLPKLRQLIEEFRDKLCDLFEEKPGTRTYQLNIQLFPLSKKQKEKKMKYPQNLLKVTFLFLLLNVNPAFSGGDVKNGGGGEAPQDASWIPVQGIGELLANAKPLPYLEQLRNFSESHPDLLVTKCAESDFAFLKLPSALERKVKFYYQDEPNFLTGFFGAKSTLEPIENDFDELCDNEALATAYGSLLLTLNQMMLSDSIGQYLMDKILSLKNQISFIVQEDQETIPAKGGSIEEFTWFDHKTGNIYWSNRSEREGFEAFLGRSDLSYLRHELTHLLIFYALDGHIPSKSRYPKITVWHDVSEGTRKEKGGYGSILYAKFKTSEEAAFIEGLAFALEKGTFMEHPFILDMSESINSLHKSQDSGTYVYTSFLYDFWGIDTAGVMTFKDGKYNPPIESEVYLASAIHKLFLGFRSRAKEDIERDDYPIYIYHSSNEENIKYAIDAVATHAPLTAQDFAKAYDAVSGSNLGYRWLREFFFHDYKTNQNIASELAYVFWGRKKTLGVPVDKLDLFFTPFMDELEQEAVQKAQTEFASHFESSDIRNRIQQATQKSDDRVLRFDVRRDDPYGYTDFLLDLKDEIESRVHIDKDLQPYRDPLTAQLTEDGYKFSEKLYHHIEQRYRRIIYLATIYDFIRDALVLPRAVEERKLVLTELQRLKDMPTKKGTCGHTQRVIDMMRLIRELNQKDEEIIDLMILQSAVSKYFVPDLFSPF